MQVHVLKLMYLYLLKRYGQVYATDTRTGQKQDSHKFHSWSIKGGGGGEGGFITINPWYPNVL